MSTMPKESDFENDTNATDTPIMSVSDCTQQNLYNTADCNKWLLKKEFQERKRLLNDNEAAAPDYIYPLLDDPNFNVKIATKKEFNDTKYDGMIYADVKAQADSLAAADFELQPHQAFVKNFISGNTPYNGLVLYWSTGAGKTCAAIGVTEEVRDAMRELGQTKKIIIVASENVQENFKLQLFDERKLKFVDGQWTIKSCLGNKLLREINPTNMKGFTAEKIISLIKNIIRTYYVFMGYGQFANYIRKIITGREENKNRAEDYDNIELTPTAIRTLRREFLGRMIVIDEVHNIRKTEESEKKKVAIYLDILVEHVRNMKLLFLSATPMFNSYKEIIWLINVMNMNDNRARIRVSDVFDAEGNFKEGGKELLMAKATGYVSHVRGENPYTFPYRVYPEQFARNHTFKVVKYPNYQMNLKRIKAADKKRVIDLYLNFMGGCGGQCMMSAGGACQSCCYKYIIEHLRHKSFSQTTKEGRMRTMPDFENMESFGYSILQIPLESLIISYPIEGLNETLEELEREQLVHTGGAAAAAADDDDNMWTEAAADTGILPPVFKFSPSLLTGKGGLDRLMSGTKQAFLDELQYNYRRETLAKYGRIFAYDRIGKYSVKIRAILDFIKRAKGVVLVYSQYIEGGIVPMALALEEMGFVRYSDDGSGAANILHHGPDGPQYVDVRTMEPPASRRDFMPARYAMITGNIRLSPNNIFDVKGLTGEGNRDGHVVKVVLVSKAGAEGIDLKFIRQVHILEPWYNMNRIEQIIGRAVRNFSHKDLPFEERNVQIFMHGTIINDTDEEAADLYVYRVAEYKAIQIGRVTRVLKESAVDCILNHDQTNFTQETMAAALKTPVTQNLSTGEVLRNFKIGDAPFSTICDYMGTCQYACVPNAKKIDLDRLNLDTYNENFIYLNSEKIAQKVRLLMREGYFYKKSDFIRAIQTPRPYPIIQIYATLTNFIEDRSETVVDRYGRVGYLQNIGEYYLFLPQELTDKYAAIFDRMRPIDFKHRGIQYQLDPRLLVDVQQPQTPKQPHAAAAAAAPIYKNEQGQRLYEKLRTYYQIAVHEMEQGTAQQEAEAEADTAADLDVVAENDDWYRTCGKLMRRVLTDFGQKFSITADKLREYLADHILDTIVIYAENRALLNYISADATFKSVNNKRSFEWHVKQYFERKIVALGAPAPKGTRCILFYNYSQNKRLYLHNDNLKWTEMDPDDIIEYNVETQMRQALMLRREQYNAVVGFIGYVPKADLLAFKVINLQAKRDVGYLCMQAGKKKVIETLNAMLGEEFFTKDNTKQIKEGGRVVQMLLQPPDLCIIEEFLMRAFDAARHQGRRWFIGPEMALLNDLYKIFAK